MGGNLFSIIIDNFGPEDAEHYAVVQWCDVHHIDIFHVPNSTFTSRTSQIKNTLLGVRSGIPDLWIPIAEVGMLVIEMKRPDVKGQTKGKLSPTQKEWMDRLDKVPGVQTFTCYGATEAIEIITSYHPRFARNGVTTTTTLPRP